jgi:hypothetical protein
MSGASVVQVAGLARVGGRGERRKKRWSRESHTNFLRNKERSCQRNAKTSVNVRRVRKTRRSAASLTRKLDWA